MARCPFLRELAVVRPMHRAFSMRPLLAALLVAGLATPALADVTIADIPPPGGIGEPQPPPRYVKGETIIVHGTAPNVVKVLPHPKKNYHRMAPPYSDEAIQQDAWARAWVLLDLDARGSVQRVKLLTHPGHGLDTIAVDHAFKMKFDPAEDASGHAVGTLLLWSMEWPSYWWLVARDEPPNRVPWQAEYVRCRNDGPMNLDHLHKEYRDCRGPDLSRIAEEPWVAAR